VSAERIGATWLRAALAPVSDFGRRAEDAAQTFGPADAAAAQARCGQVVELAGQLDPDGVAHLRAALRRAPDPTDIVSRAKVGDALGDVDFFEIGRFADALEAIARAWDGARGPAAGRPPVLPQVADLLARGRDGGSFFLADRFAEPLAQARGAYALADEQVVRERERLGRALEAVLGALPQAEEFIVMRDVLAQVPPGVRVVRETPAYRLLALELDEAALTAGAARETALARVEAQEEAVRRDLAAAVATYGPHMLAAAQALGELDRTLARVAFTQRWGGCVPSVTPAAFAFAGASFAPLRERLEAEGLPYTPISIEVPGVAVLTGPNMGGKSAALATCGFLAACLSSGVPPPAEQAALPLFELVGWIGGEQAADRARLLSAFGGEVVRTRDMLAASAQPALLLIDEFARTTGPREGRALLVALVEALARRGTFALVSTHFDGIARDAQVAHLAIAGLGERTLDAHAARDIHAALDAVAQAMDYRIIAVSGEATSPSDALALAGLLGLDAPIVARAAQLYADAAAGPARRATE
jgi:DNA mismatch repair protein MutS2